MGQCHSTEDRFDERSSATGEIPRRQFELVEDSLAIAGGP